MNRQWPAWKVMVGTFPVIVLIAAFVELRGGGDASTPPPTTTTVAAAEPVLEAPVEPESPEPVSDGTFVVSAGENTGVDLTELADAIELRLAAAGHTAAFGVPEGAGVRVDPGDGPLARPAIEELLAEPGRLEIRPVRRQPGVRQCEDPPTAQGADDDALYPELATTGEDEGEIVACYALAPGGVTNAAVERATVTVNAPDQDGDRDDDYAVDLVLTFDGIDAFNEMAGACKRRESPCDSGLAGIALDRVVLMAPRVKDEEFTRVDIQISGDIDEEEANSLVAALTTAPLPRGLEFTD